MSNRIMDSLIFKEQTGFIKGRQFQNYINQFTNHQWPKTLKMKGWYHPQMDLTAMLPESKWIMW